MSQFSIGDQVKVINYGSLFVTDKEVEGNLYKKEWDKFIYDLIPSIVGQKGIITAVIGEENTAYTIFGIPGKTSWYDDGQLELVYRPEYII